MDLDTLLGRTILLAVAGDPALAARLLDGVPADRVLTLLSLAEREELGPAVAVAVRSCGDESVRRRASDRIRKSVQWDLATARTIAATRSALQQAGVDSLFLKGAAFREMLYPEPWFRPMVDVDLRVRGRDLDGASDALVAAGFVRTDSGVRPFTDRHELERKFLPPGRGIRVELHGGPINDRGGFGTDFYTLLRRSRPLPSGGRTLCAEDHVVEAAVHSAWHSFRGPMKGALDLHLLVGSPGFDADAAAATARKWGCSTALAVALDQARAFFGTALPPALPSVASLAGPRSWILRATLLRQARPMLVQADRREAAARAAWIQRSWSLVSRAIAMDDAGLRTAFIAWGLGSRAADAVLRRLRTR